MTALRSRSSRIRHRRLVARVAALALLLNAVVPIYAMAAATGTSGRIPVCTGSGIVWIVPGNAAPTKSKKPTAPCPYCLAQAAAFAPPAPVSIAVPLHADDTVEIVIANDTDFHRLAYTPHRSRAPPPSA